MDLAIRNARVRGQQRLIDIAIGDDRISAVAPNFPARAQKGNRRGWQPGFARFVQPPLPCGQMSVGRDHAPECVRYAPGCNRDHQ